MILVATQTEMDNLSNLLIKKYKDQFSIPNTCCCDLVLVTEDSSSVHLSGYGNKESPLIATVKISGAIGNALSINSDGLFATGGGGSGTVTAANTGVSLVSTTVQLGQAIGAVGNPAALTSNREIPVGAAYPAPDYTLSIMRDISAFSPLYPIARSTYQPHTIGISATDGGFISINVEDSTNIYGDAYPSIQYSANNVLQVFSGMHYTASDKHYDIADLRASMTSAQIQAGGQGLAIFKTDGHIFLGGTGAGKVTIGRLVTGGTAKLNIVPSTAAAAPLRIENIGAIIPTSPNDGDIWITAPTTPQHLFARLDGVTYQLDQQTAASTVPINGLLAATGTNTIDNLDFTQEWDFSTLSSNTGLFLFGNTTAAAFSNQHLFQATLLGANSNSGQITYAGWFSNAHTGITSTNVAGNFIAASGTTNIAGQFSANLGTNNLAIYVNAGVISNSLTPTASVLNLVIPTSIATTTASGIYEAMNTLTTGTGHYISSSSVTSGKLLDVAISGTAGIDGQTGINISLSGALATIGPLSTYGIQSSNTHTGTIVTNYGGKFSASGGTANYGIAGFSTTINSANDRGGYFSGNATVISTNTTAVGTASAFDIQANALTTGTAFNIINTSLTSGHLVDLIISAGTAGLTGQTALNIAITGVNASSTQTTYGLRVSNAHTGTGAINYAATFDRGKVSIGTAGTESGILEFNGLISGTVTIKPNNIAGTWTFFLPQTAGTNNYVLKTNGSGITDWIDVTSLVPTFTLTNGSGTTANGTGVDLGGLLTSDVLIDGSTGGGPFYFNIFNPTKFLVSSTTYTGGLLSVDTATNSAWIGDYNNGTPENTGTYILVDDVNRIIRLKSDAHAGTAGILLHSRDVTDGAVAAGDVWTIQNITTGAGEWKAVDATLAVGSTVITSGSTTNILYNNGGILGEYTTTGTGTVVALANQPSFITGFKIGGTATSGTFPIGDGTNFVQSTLKLPNGSTANRLVYSTTANQYGDDAGLTYSSSTFTRTTGTTTGATTSSGSVFLANSLTSGTAVYIASSSLTQGNLLQLISSSTALNTGNEILDIAVSGANANNAITVTGVRISVVNTNATSGTNVALDLTASGATTDNIAILTTGAIRQTTSNTTGATTSAANTLNANSLTTGTAMYIASSSISSGILLDMATTGTAAAANNAGIKITRSGANATNAITVSGIIISITNTNATSGTNIGIDVTTTGATTKNVALLATGGAGSSTSFAAQFVGRVAMGGCTAPFADLDMANGTIATGAIIVTTSAGTNQTGNFSTGAQGLVGSNVGSIYQLLSSSTVNAHVYIGGTGATAVGAGLPYGTLIIGAAAAVEASSGVHPLFASLIVLPPTPTTGAATMTKAATVYIDDATNFTVTDANYALYIRLGNTWTGGKIVFDSTYTAGGTTGNQTINKPSGSVNIAAAGTTVTVTNSFCVANSLVYAWCMTNDTTAYIKNIVVSAGSFVVTLGAATTAETKIGFIVMN